jgi:hypothetical protein
MELMDGVAQAVFLREGGEFSVAIARETAQRADPKAAVFGRPQRPTLLLGSAPFSLLKTTKS